MAMGDWTSDSWHAYVAATQRLRFSAADLLSKKAEAIASAEPQLHNLLDYPTTTGSNNEEALPH